VDAVDNDGDTVLNDGCPVLGTVQNCARVNHNGILDADEDSIDTVSIDIVAMNIPLATPMIAWAFEMDYPASLNVTARTISYLIGAGPGSAPT